MISRRLLLSALPLLIVAARPHLSGAQSLRGSPASVNHMYHRAVRHDLYFYETAAGVRRAAKAGRLVRLTGNGYGLKGVSYPYVKPSTRTFVERLASEYRSACGKTLIVTSAARPARRQPPNSSPRSVHPTGIAVDIHKPSGRCLSWLRNTLLELEQSGVIEATEEFAPPHFHVAVFPQLYTQYVAVLTRRSRPSVSATLAYTVRPGDTLWDIAADRDLTVEDLEEANHLSGSVIRPGQELVIPTDR